YRVRIRCGLNINRSSATAVLWIWRAMPIFNAAVDIQHGLVIPCGIAGFLREEIPIVLMSARPGHDIDARSSAEHLAHRQGNGASVETWIGLGNKLPVAFASQILKPAKRFGHAWHIVVA